MSWFFNKNAAIVAYSTATFQFLAVPYIFFALGTALRSLFIGTGKTLYYLVPSTVVNLGIYIPLGILVKANVFVPTFEQLMVISFAVFASDLVIVSMLVRRQYRELAEELPTASGGADEPARGTLPTNPS